jgi:metal-sulfur cluster biosynthetic enzyme
MPAATPTASSDELAVRDALRHVLDPEVGVNVVDLGLVYGVSVVGEVARVTMTMTTAACPLAEHLRREVELIVRSRCSRIARVDVELVWEPRWTPERISQEARETLGW